MSEAERKLANVGETEAVENVETPAARLVRIFKTHGLWPCMFEAQEMGHRITAIPMFLKKNGQEPMANALGKAIHLALVESGGKSPAPIRR